MISKEEALLETLFDATGCDLPIDEITIAIVKKALARAYEQGRRSALRSTHGALLFEIGSQNLPSEEECGYCVQHDMWGNSWHEACDAHANEKWLFDLVKAIEEAAQ